MTDNVLKCLAAIVIAAMIGGWSSAAYGRLIPHLRRRRQASEWKRMHVNIARQIDAGVYRSN